MIDEDIELNDGTVVWIDSYFVSRTYEELEGDEHDSRANEFVLNTKHHLLEKMWISVPSVIVRKSAYEADLAKPLPRIAVHMTLRSLWKQGETNDGSHLAVIFLQEAEWPLFSIENLDSFKALTWKEHAVDFSY